MSELDPRQLRQAFGSFMTGVTVVTALSDDGVPVGFTANSFSSVSLDPPLLLVCPARSLASYAIFAGCRHFAVNILAEHQQDVSNIFATAKDDRFAQVAWQPDDKGCPLIAGAAASFSCATHQAVEAGDHLILVGRIEAFQASGALGLGYSSGGYFSLGLERAAAEQPRANRQETVGAIIEWQGQLLLVETPAGLRPIEVAATSRSGTITALRAHLAALGLAVELGPVYSIFDNSTTGIHRTYYRGSAADGRTGGLGHYLPVNSLSEGRFASPALSNMMARYLLERRTGIFSLYVGNETEGEVHLFGEG